MLETNIDLKAWGKEQLLNLNRAVAREDYHPPVASVNGSAEKELGE